MTASPNNRIWFDACIRPNCAMSDRGLALVALGLFAPSLTFGAVMLAARAWPASAFLGGEALLVCAALYFSAFLRAPPQATTRTRSAHERRVDGGVLGQGDPSVARARRADLGARSAADAS